MAESAQFPQQRLRFGAYEVDLRAGELWKAGRKRKLTGQPFSVLAILLERPGEVVSREELQKRLWPDTFVDVDHNLNTAINKIREALNDSSERPQYIETLSRRGYRFIAAVESVQPAVPPGPNPAGRASSIASENGAIATPVQEIAPVPEAISPGVAQVQISHSKFSGKWRVAVWSAIVVAALVVLYLLRPMLPPPQVTGITQLTQDDTTKLPSREGARLLTEGSRIYFAVGFGSQPRLMQVSTDGGEPQPVEMPFPFDGLDDISPSQPELLIGGPPLTPTDDGDGLWVLPVPGGQARRIGNLFAFDSTWTPDGTAIYYSTGPYIFKANTDGSQPRKILTLTANGTPFWLRFSTDGRLLRFSATDPKSNTTSLWEAHADGSHLRRLFAHWDRSTDECCGNWTSDGKDFLFQATHDGVTSLWAQRVKWDWWRKVNYAPVQLTVGEMNSASPLPSKDGTKVFFIGAAQRDELVRYDVKTRAFTPYLPGLSAEGLSFTRDGKRVAYVSYPEGVLWQSRTDGSDRHQLSFPPVEVGLPRWSPDGTRIAFSAHNHGERWQIFVVPAEGGATQQLTSGNSYHLDASWSPDGNSLVFGGSAVDAMGSKEKAIHIMNLKTLQVTDVPDSAGLFSPRWSPDGRYLLAITVDFRKLMLYDFTIGKWKVLVEMGQVAYPSWSHDGKCVYFSDNGIKTLPVYRICLSDRKPEFMIGLSAAARPALGSFGWWTGLGPGDSIIAARDTGIEEIYALDTRFPK